MHVVAVQEILGHEWLNTAMIYVHVEKSHAEDAWIPIRTRLSITLPVPDQESGPGAQEVRPRSRDRGRLARCSAGGLGICPASP